MTKISAVFGVLAVAGIAAAQVSSGSFTPDAIDDYESYAGGRTTITALFGGTVPVIPGSVDHRSVDQGGWSDFRSPGGPIQPTSGTKFGVLFGFGDITLDFTGLGGIFGFSGFASAAGVGDDTVTFFDMSGNQIGQDVIAGGFGPGDGTMEAFSYVSTVAIGSINLDGRESTFDDLGYTTVPAPATLAALAGLGAFASRRRRA